MEKATHLTPVLELVRRIPSINFPEYQREPNVWSRIEKQRLIDSIIRRFDIASIYLYVDEEGATDCIDGRQRLGAIMSFMGLNPEDSDNGFDFRILNEIGQDEDHPFQALDGESFVYLRDRPPEDLVARSLVSTFLSHEITVVELSGSRRPEEFNLQFTRLNLGTILNSGEKLNAMVGDLRDECFGDKGLGKHPFFVATRIPTRRFATEQVAAQIVAQVLSLSSTGEFTRTRHFDLQRVFKQHLRLSDSERQTLANLRQMLDVLDVAFAEVATLRNRAITVSTVLLAWLERVKDKKRALRWLSSLMASRAASSGRCGRGLMWISSTGT